MDYSGLSWVPEYICGQLTVSWEALLLGVGWLLARTMGITRPCDSFHPAGYPGLVTWGSMFPRENEQKCARSLEGRVRTSMSSFPPHVTPAVFYWSKQVTRPAQFEEVQKKTLPLNGAHCKWTIYWEGKNTASFVNSFTVESLYH